MKKPARLNWASGTARRTLCCHPEPNRFLRPLGMKNTGMATDDEAVNLTRDKEGLVVSQGGQKALAI